MAPATRFYWKAFVSFSVLFTFTAIALSGFVLYVAPPGRVANWAVWTLGSLEKADWQAVHTIFALLFLGAAIVHVFFNWRVILAYLRMRLATGVQRRRELAVAATLSTAILVGTLAGAPPFSNVMALGEELKNGWVAPETEAPVPHAELLPLAKLADTLRVPVQDLVKNLERAGVAASPESTLARLAVDRGETPVKMYAIAISGMQKLRPAVAEGGGYGQKTIAEVCRQIDVALPSALERLRTQGIAADGAENVKEVAQRHQRLPIEIVKVLAGE
jgi:hypothetical protein